MPAIPERMVSQLAHVPTRLTRVLAEHGASAFMVPMSELRTLAPVIEALKEEP